MVAYGRRTGPRKKKTLLMIVVLAHGMILTFGLAGCGDADDVDDAEDGEEEMVDTVWVYFTDGTFEQFAEIDDQFAPFSTGSYEFGDGGDFIYEAGEESHGVITINREKKYATGEGLVDYESSHTYELGSLGFDQYFVIIE